MHIPPEHACGQPRPQVVTTLPLTLGAAMLALVLLLALPLEARAKRIKATAFGSCAIASITPAQAQHLALRRARAAAVETAAGVDIASSTLVTDGRLAGDFIKTFTRGFIVHEEVAWEPVGQYQPDPSRPPILEYRVRVTAEVEIPDGVRPMLGLAARLNRKLFRARTDKLSVTASTAAPARLAVFNITADDHVVMLYPDGDGPLNLAGRGRKIVLPDPDSGRSMLLDTVAGHKRDVEAVLVAAARADSGLHWDRIFVAGRSMGLTDFFSRYSSVAGDCEDVILTYEVFKDD